MQIDRERGAAVHQEPGKQTRGALKNVGGRDGLWAAAAFASKLRIFRPRVQNFAFQQWCWFEKECLRALVIRDLFAQDEAMSEKNTQLNNADQHKSYYTRNSTPTPPQPSLPDAFIIKQRRGLDKKKNTKSEENLWCTNNILRFVAKYWH